jgi:hypothetical protein
MMSQEREWGKSGPLQGQKDGWNQGEIWQFYPVTLGRIQGGYFEEPNSERSSDRKWEQGWLEERRRMWWGKEEKQTKPWLSKEIRQESKRKWWPTGTTVMEACKARPSVLNSEAVEWYSKKVGGQWINEIGIWKGKQIGQPEGKGVKGRRVRGKGSQLEWRWTERPGLTGNSPIEGKFRTLSFKLM